MRNSHLPYPAGSFVPMEGVSRGVALKLSFFCIVPLTGHLWWRVHLRYRSSLHCCGEEEKRRVILTLVVLLLEIDRPLQLLA